jgi:hypothetical protein
MDLNYAREKLAVAVELLASSSKSLNERLQRMVNGRLSPWRP